MKIVGIIAEYNPFHNGHQYHIEEALKITGADAAIVVMSGDFVQRGAPAIMSKHLRAKMALTGGASLVLELPVPYATGSAEYFAYGAVSLLDQLACVDALCFGSECGDLSKLQSLAEILVNEPLEYKNYLAAYLKQGNSFPLARQYAIRDYLNSDEFEQIIAEPNNILGIEYLKALYRLNSNIKPFTIQRVSSNYHDQELQETYSSASAIRNKLRDSDLNTLSSQLSSANFALLMQEYGSHFPIYANDFSLLLKWKLMQETKETLFEYTDVSEELANRIQKRLSEFMNFEQFCELLKTKDMTYARISRSLIHILLNIRKEAYCGINYARVLGFKREHAEILSRIKQKSSIPLVTKLSKAESPDMIQIDIDASDLYESVVTEKFQTPYQSEYTKQIVIL